MSFFFLYIWTYLINLVASCHLIVKYYASKITEKFLINIEDIRGHLSIAGYAGIY